MRSPIGNSFLADCVWISEMMCACLTYYFSLGIENEWEHRFELFCFPEITSPWIRKIHWWKERCQNDGSTSWLVGILRGRIASDQWNKSRNWAEEYHLRVGREWNFGAEGRRDWPIQPRLNRCRVLRNRQRCRMARQRRWQSPIWIACLQSCSSSCRSRNSPFNQEVKWKVKQLSIFNF